MGRCVTFLAAMVLLACAVQLGRFLADVESKARVDELMARNSKLFDELNTERLKNQNLELQVTGWESKLLGIDTMEYES